MSWTESESEFLAIFGFPTHRPPPKDPPAKPIFPASPSASPLPPKNVAPIPSFPRKETLVGNLNFPGK